MQDLGWLVGSMMVAALAGIPFLLPLLLAGGTGMPRWMRVVAVIGMIPGAIAGVMLLLGRF